MRIFSAACRPMKDASHSVFSALPGFHMFCATRQDEDGVGLHCAPQIPRSDLAGEEPRKRPRMETTLAPWAADSSGLLDCFAALFQLSERETSFALPEDQTQFAT